MTVDKNPDGSTLDQPVMIQYVRRVPAAGLPRFLALLQTPGEDLEQTLRLVRQQFCESVKGVSYEVTLNMPGVVHESFSDIPFLASGPDEAAKKVSRSAIDITRTYTRAFFDRHLRGLPAPPLDNPPAERQRSRADPPYVPRAVSHATHQEPISVVACFGGFLKFAVYIRQLPLVSCGSKPTDFASSSTFLRDW